MYNKKTVLTISVITTCIAIFSACSKNRNEITFVPIDKVQLGKKFFFDKNLSNPIGQSCASCHNPGAGFTDADHGPTSRGAVNGLFGNRNCPTVSYAVYSPLFHFDTDDSVYVGGMFLDGRVNTLQEQAMKPFLNPLEMNNTDGTMVISKLRNSEYYPLYTKIYGEANDDNKAFANIADAISMYEQSREVNAFSSKYDLYLKGKLQLTDQELRGLQLFNDTAKGNCASCHVSEADEDAGFALFTDFTYDNIGVPKNPNNPFYILPVMYNPIGANALDYGLGAIVNDAAFNGAFKVSTLRNVELTAPYFHNGYYKTLEEVVHFYNKRDVDPTIPAAEFPTTMNKKELGDLKLTEQEEKDIVVFLKTLTDGYHQ